MSSPNPISGAIASISAKADLTTLFCLVVFCIVLLVLAYLTNPTETSFRAYLTEQSFRQHLTRLEASYDDDSNVHDHRNTLPLSAKGPPASSFTDSTPFHFSNRASISLRTPKHIFHTFGIFTVAIVVPVTQFPAVHGQSPASTDSWYIGALGRWCRVGPFDAWYQEAFLKVKDEEGWSSGILQIKNLDTVTALPLTRKSNQRPPQALRGVHLKLKIRDRLSQPISSSPRPSQTLHRPDMLPLHNPVAAPKSLPQSQTPSADLIALNERPSRRVSSFYDQTPAIAKFLSEIGNSRTSILDLRTQLVDFQVAATQSRDILQYELGACRDRKRQEDVSKADTKSRTKLLDDMRRNAESVRRDAEKRLKTVQQEHTRSHMRLDHLDKEILQFQEQIQTDKLSVTQSNTRHSDLEGEITTHLERTRIEIKFTEDALLSLNVQARNLEERLVVEREKLKLVKERLASSAKNHSPSEERQVDISDQNRVPASLPKSEANNDGGFPLSLSPLHGKSITTHPISNFDGYDPPATSLTRVVDQDALSLGDWQNRSQQLGLDALSTHLPELASTSTYDTFDYSQPLNMEPWLSPDCTSKLLDQPPRLPSVWVRDMPRTTNSSSADPEEDLTPNNSSQPWKNTKSLNPDASIFSLPVSDATEPSMYEGKTPATRSSLLRAFAPSPAERQALQRAFGGTKKSSLERLPNLIDVDPPHSLVHAQMFNPGRSKVLPSWIQSIPLPIYRTSNFCPWDDEDMKDSGPSASSQIDLAATQI